MNEEQQKAIDLLKRYREDNCTEYERAIVDSWTDYEVLEGSWDILPAEKAKVKLKLKSKIDLSRVVEPKRHFQWAKLAVAAVLAVILFGIVFFKTDKPTAPEVSLTKPATDVAPAIVGATLTLANGKKIKLADVATGALAKESGILISKNESGVVVYEINGSVADPYAVNVLSTDRGETSQVILPDGSVVHLNAASSLAYTTSLMKNGRREVKLTGEGYFEVAKDKKHPFIVVTDKQEVEVLGTHFNINSYPDEKVVKTTLLEGSVKVIPFGYPARLLKPGQQSLVTNTGLSVVSADMDVETAWKNGDFFFSGQDIEEVMRAVSRWYNVDVEFKIKPKTRHLRGEISRSKKLSTILKLLEGSGDVKFSVIDKKIIVTN